MIPGLQDTPPSVAFLAGFFLAAALRRARLVAIIHNFIGGTGGSESTPSPEQIEAHTPSDDTAGGGGDPENPADDPNPQKTEDTDPGSQLAGGGGGGGT